MKPLYLCVPLACCCALSSPAQDLTVNSTAYSSPRSTKEITVETHPEFPRQKPWVWKKSQDQVNGHIDRTLLKTMTKTTQAIVALLRDSCLSEGAFIPDWHGEFFSEKRSLSSRMKFGLECHFQASSDSAGSIGNPGNNSQIRVIANDFTILFRDTLYVNGKSFQTLKGTEAIMNGFPYFEYRITGEDPTNEQPGHTKCWLVTMSQDKLPYVPVTRKEYLEEAAQEVKAEKNKLIAAIQERMPVRPADMQKAEKERELDQIRQTYSGAEMEMRARRFLQSYKTDEDYQKEGIDKGTVDVDATLHLFDSLLTHLSADELKKPAVVTGPAIEFQAFEDSLPDHRMLVQVNPAYFEASMTGEKPQCFIVCWSYNPSEPVAADIDRQLNEKFNFGKLKDLLGK